MTQEQKELLFKDLCGRLPYKVYAQIPDEYGGYTSAIESIDIDGFVKDFEGTQIEVENIKPYLLLLSSMTEKQKKKLLAILEDESDDGVEYKVVDFYNSNHLDYRGLIPKGLANDATNKKIY